MQDDLRLFSWFDQLPLTEADFQLARPLVQEVHYPKGSILLQKGEVCQHIHFVMKGIAQNSTLENQAKKVVHVFF